MKAKKKTSLLKKAGLVLAGLITLVVILIVIGIVLAPDYARKKTPAGFPVNNTHYLRLDEKTNVWISVWLPPSLTKDEKIPVLMTTSRYSGQLESGWLAKVLQTYFRKPDPNFQGARRFLDNGYAFVWVQSPGSCQSSGPRLGEYPPNEVEAMGLAIDWIVRQPWSNQRVGAFGASYSGTTADLACAALRPALKAVYPKAPDFDDYRQTVKPGGLGSSEFIRIWGGMVKAMDANDFATVMSMDSGKKLSFFETLYLRSLIGGLQRPRGKDRAIFKQALEDHRLTPAVEDLVRQMEFKDSGFEDVSVYEYRDKIEKAQVNTNTRAGWMDAGVAKEKDNAAFIRQVAQLRHRLVRFFYAGQMARPPRLGGSVPTVTADWQWSGVWPVTTDAVLTGAWELPAERRLAMIFVNVSDKPVEAEFKVRDEKRN